MSKLLPAIIILCVISAAAIAASVYFWSKRRAAAGEEGEQSTNVKSDTFFKAALAVAIIAPLLVILLVVFGLSDKNNSSPTGDNGAPESPADPNGEGASLPDGPAFEPLEIRQMTYRELRRHNFMLMSWIEKCDESGEGSYMLSTKYEYNGDTIREMLLYVNNAGYSVELMPDDDTYPDPEGVYFNLITDETKTYTLAYYSMKEIPANPGDFYITHAGKVLDLSDSGWGGNPETLFPMTTDFSRKTEMAEALFAKRTDYVGDNSAVGGLLDTMHCQEFGNYDIALKTGKKPYRITVAYSSVDLSMEEYHKYEEPSLHDFTAVIFALIGNVDEVEWSIDGVEAVLYTRDQFDKEYGGSIGSYGSSEDTFIELWNMLDI